VRVTACWNLDHVSKRLVVVSSVLIDACWCVGGGLTRSYGIWCRI